MSTPSTSLWPLISGKHYLLFQHPLVSLLKWAVLIRALWVVEWEPIPVNQILEKNNEIYDSHLPDQRNLVDDLENLEMTDASRVEQWIYNWNSQKIPHREALIDKSEPLCGILVKLNNIGLLFQWELGSIEGTDLLKIGVYPMGFLHDLGHVQVNRAMPAFDDLLNQINLTWYTSVDMPRARLRSLNARER